MKKLTILIFAVLLSGFFYAQPDSSFHFIAGKWNEGRLSKSRDTITAVEPNMAGIYVLKINTDSSVSYNEPFSCGFAYKREGKWTINKADSTIIFKFERKMGYMNNPSKNESISQTESYKIIQLTERQLILKSLNKEDKYIAFIKPERQ